MNETIVREFFEQHEFLVRQYRKHIAPAGREEDDFDFLVINPKPEPRATLLPFALSAADMKAIKRAIVVIKAWHTDVFTPALITNTPKLFRFLEKRAFHQAAKEFAEGSAPLKILVIPCLPNDSAAQTRSIEILREKGINAVISFRTMLADLVRRVEPNRNYQKSDLLQMIRILKNYDFFKEPQLDLFKTRKPARPEAMRVSKPAPMN